MWYVGCPPPIRQKMNQFGESESGDSCRGSWRNCGPHTRYNAGRPLAFYTETRYCRTVCRLCSFGPALPVALPARAYCLRVRDPGVRGGLLIGVGLLSLVASFPILSALFFVLLPATFIIWFAAVRSLTASEHLLVIAAPATVAGLLTAGLLCFSFFTLLWMGNEDQKGRCWALTRGDDLSSRWESRPSVGDPEGRGVWVSGVDLWATCASRTTEAWVSIGAVAAALLGMTVVSRWSGLPVSEVVRSY